MFDTTQLTPGERRIYSALRELAEENFGAPVSLTDLTDATDRTVPYQVLPALTAYGLVERCARGLQLVGAGAVTRPRSHQPCHRPCMRCRTVFLSEGFHNRLCDCCRDKPDSSFDF